MDNSKNTTKIVGSIAVAALAGAVLGVLFAPNKGKKTRKKIVGKTKAVAKDFRKRINKEAKDFKKNATKESKMLKKEVEKIEDKSESTIKNVSASLKEKANALLQMNTDHEVSHK
ncbi:YtxH domain-containing protein [Flavobacterium sp.]|uniref:YtxH domain-containing protein n=1 Tax=Flavobacterium sp. TaxID=239 RepID=UPI003750B8BC